MEEPPKEIIPVALPPKLEETGFGIDIVRQSEEKVDRLAFHPSQPYLAYVDRVGRVGVWDYESNETVYMNQLGGADDGAMQEYVLRKRAEHAAAALLGGKQGQLPTPKNDPKYSVKSAASGRVNDIIFLDHSTCLMQQAAQASIGNSCYETCGGISQLNKKSIKGISKHCWIVAACDNKVSFHDLASSRTHDFSRSSIFESKSPTRLAVLVYNSRNFVRMPVHDASEAAREEYIAFPVLAVGTSSGSIYLIHPEKGVLYGKCTGGHSKAVTAMKVIGPSSPGGPDRLVTASADGTLAVWDPSITARSMTGSAIDISPSKTVKAHDGGVHDLEFFGLPKIAADGRVALQSYVASVGADKQLATWNAVSWMQEFVPLQALPKDSLVCISTTNRSGLTVGSDVPIIGISNRSCTIFGLDPKESKVNNIMDVERLVDKGEKKAPKIYHMRVNQTNPDLVALATNTGIVILRDKSHPIPGSMTLCAQNLFVAIYNKLNDSKRTEEEQTEEKPEETDMKKIPQGVTAINVMEGKLVASIYKMELNKSQKIPDRTMQLENLGSLVMAELDHPVQEPILIENSPSGKSMSVLWPNLERYSIYGCSDEYTWHLIDSGIGKSIVWSSTAPIYAVLSGDVQTLDMIQQLKPEEINVDPQIDQQPATEIQFPTIEPSRVKVHAIDETSNPKYVGANEVSLGGARPMKIFGGALLGITATDATSGDCSLRFFSWVDFSPIGNNLPNPRGVSWEPECTMCALLYDSGIQLFSVYPSFHCFASLAISKAESALWQSRQLYVSNTNGLYLVFADPLHEYVQEVFLADFHGHASEISGSSGAEVFGPVRLRPAGPVRLVGIKHSHLIIHDAHERPFILSLRNHGLRARSLAAKGDIAGASALTIRNIHAPLHDNIGQFLIAMGSGRDYEESLRLPGLSPEMEISIAIRNEDWNRASLVFQAYALGVSNVVYSSLTGIESKTSVVGLTSPQTTVERNMATVSNILEEAEREQNGLSDSEEGSTQDQSSDQNASETEDESEGNSEEEFVDPVDWDTWDEGIEDIKDIQSKQKSVSATPTLDTSELQRILQSVDLGLDLSDLALNGHTDAARTVLGALLGYAPMLPKGRLKRLVEHMVMGGMTESLRNVLASIIVSPPNNALHSTAVASLIAASVGGLQDGPILDSLKSSGLYPLAFLFSAVWGQGNPDACEDSWRESINHRS